MQSKASTVKIQLIAFIAALEQYLPGTLLWKREQHTELMKQKNLPNLSMMYVI